MRSRLAGNLWNKPPKHDRSVTRRGIEALESRVLFAVQYVDASSPGPTHDGTSWNSAYLDLQLALAAATAGDEIWVADGTYFPSAADDLSASFQLKNGVVILGGFAGSGAADPDDRDISTYLTVLSGNIGEKQNSEDNSLHIVVGSNTDQTAVLDGFTITEGNSSFGSTGAGMYNVAGSPTLRYCTFKGLIGSSAAAIYNSNSSPSLFRCDFIGNSATFGGAISNWNSTSVLVECTFIGNSAKYGAGGAISNQSSNVTLTDCTFRENVGGTGGAIKNQSSSPVLTNCLFIDNIGSSGGAVDNSGVSSPIFMNCTFTGNRTSIGWGGAMHNLRSSPMLIDCVFEGNAATSGGGIFNHSANPTLRGCTFRGNSNSAVHNLSSSPLIVECEFTGQSNGAPAVYGTDNSAPTLIDCVFRANGRWGMGNSGSATLINCAFIGNKGGLYIGSGSPVLVNCSFVGNRPGSIWTGGGLHITGGSVKLVNCTVVSNDGDIYNGRGGGIHVGSGASVSITNSIIWSNIATEGAGIYVATSASAIVSRSTVQGGFAGGGNSDADPLFNQNPAIGPDGIWATPDDDYGDLRLQAGSPCLDAGINSAVPSGITVDLNGNERFSDIPGANDPGALVDMGAYERQGVFGVTQSILDPDLPSPLLKLSFSRAMSPGSLNPSDLVVNVVNSDGSLGTLIGVLDVSYNPATSAATFTLLGVLADGNYRGRLPAGSVSDAAGNPLGTDYTFDFFVLTGDANRDRVVDVRDLYIVSQNWLGTGKTFSQGDFNYDGTVNQADLTLMAQRWQLKLDVPPPPSAPAPASPTSAGKRAPTRTPARAIQLVM